MDAVDIVEETPVAEIAEVLNKSKAPAIFAALVVTAVAAGVGGYLLGKKRTQDLYEDVILPEQVEQAKEFYMKLGKTGDFETPESARKKLHPDDVPEEVIEAVQAYQGKGERVPYDKPEEIAENAPEVIEALVVEEKTTINVFDNGPVDVRDWDYNKEIQDRTPDKPYVISYEEFVAGEEGHEQEQLTYYVEDDILVDRRNEPIDNHDYTVGDDNLQRFGHGSKDSNVVYVRNEKLDLDFEVTRDSGSYLESVGLKPEPELKHSHQRRRRGRDADE